MTLEPGRTAVAGWTLALPTSLAELPNYVTRRPAGALPALFATSLREGATLVRVTDQPREEDFNEAEEIAFLRETPVELILGNHLFVLFQVAALRLAEVPPNLDAAQLVIDTVAAIVSATGERLGEYADIYRNALAEVQQAYVRAKTTASGPPAEG